MVRAGVPASRNVPAGVRRIYRYVLCGMCVVCVCVCVCVCLRVCEHVCGVCLKGAALVVGPRRAVTPKPPLVRLSIQLQMNTRPQTHGRPRIPGRSAGSCSRKGSLYVPGGSTCRPPASSGTHTCARVRHTSGPKASTCRFLHWLCRSTVDNSHVKACPDVAN